MFRRVVTLILYLTLVASVAGCSNISPRLNEAVTPPVTGEITALPTDTPQPHQSGVPAVPTPDADALYDALGKIIYDGSHFQQYLSFCNIRVYEENGDTFIDCYVENAYPEAIRCAVEAVFFDENGERLASGSLQMPDGSFMLVLPPGRTSLYVHVLTDIGLTEMEFEFSFDNTVGVNPI